MRNLEQVLQHISEAGLKLNDKYIFIALKLSFLGRCVSAEGIAPLQAKVGSIVHATTPTDAGILCSFLGLVEYYAKFIPHLAEEVETMRRLLCKHIYFEWDVAAEKSFAKVRNSLYLEEYCACSTQRSLLLWPQMRLQMAWVQYCNKLTVHPYELLHLHHEP